MMNDERNTHEDFLPQVRVKLDMEIPLFSEKQIKTSKDVFEMIGSYMLDLANEMSCVICFNQDMYPLCVGFIAYGTPEGTAVPTRDIIQIGLLANASHIAIVHNHPGVYPGGANLLASKADVEVADMTIKACSLMGMPLFDSIIVSNQLKFGKIVPSYYSLKEKKITNFRRQETNLYSKGFDYYLKISEDFLHWDDKKADERYWGVDMDRVKSHPYKIAFSEEDMKNTFEQIKAAEKKKERVPIDEYAIDIPDFLVNRERR